MGSDEHSEIKYKTWYDYCQMLPVLFSAGPVTFYTFGFFLAVGFFLAAFIVWRRLKDLGFKEEKIIDGIIVSTAAGLLVSRLVGTSFGHWFLVGQSSGFSFLGGLAGVILGLFWFCRRQKWDFWRVADEAAFGILPFFFLAQLGAFFDGTGQGRPTNMPWGIFFPGSLVRRHPISLLMAIFLFLIWVFLLKIERQWRTWSWYKSQAPGFIFLAFLGLVFLANFLLAFLKENSLYFYWLEIALSLLGAGVSAALIWQKRK